MRDSAKSSCRPAGDGGERAVGDGHAVQMKARLLRVGGSSEHRAEAAPYGTTLHHSSSMLLLPTSGSRTRRCWCGFSSRAAPTRAKASPRRTAAQRKSAPSRRHATAMATSCTAAARFTKAHRGALTSTTSLDSMTASASSTAQARAVSRRSWSSVVTPATTVDSSSNRPLQASFMRPARRANRASEAKVCASSRSLSSWGEAKPSRAGEAASLRRSLSATFFGFRAGAPRGGEGGEAHPSFVAAPVQAVEGHRDGGRRGAARSHRPPPGRRVHRRRAGRPSDRSSAGEVVAHLGGRRVARAASGTGRLPRRPSLVRPLKLRTYTAWLPAGGSQRRTWSIFA